MTPEEINFYGLNQVKDDTNVKKILTEKSTYENLLVNSCNLFYENQQQKIRINELEKEAAQMKATLVEEEDRVKTLTLLKDELNRQMQILNKQMKIAKEGLINVRYDTRLADARLRAIKAMSAIKEVEE